MKYCTYLLLSSLVIFSACKEETITTNGENQPNSSTCLADRDISDIDWLQEQVTQIERSDISSYFYISEAEYMNMSVILFENCCPFCGTIMTVYDCSGGLLGTLGNGEDQIRSTDLSSKRVIWQPNNFACSFN